MNKVLALGLGTVCVIAAALMWFLDYTPLAVMLIFAAVGFDLLFVKALRDERRGAGR